MIIYKKRLLFRTIENKKADASCSHVSGRFFVLKVARIEPPPHTYEQN